LLTGKPVLRAVEKESQQPILDAGPTHHGLAELYQPLLRHDAKSTALLHLSFSGSLVAHFYRTVHPSRRVSALTSGGVDADIAVHGWTISQQSIYPVVHWNGAES
jgi:hypothetical protein